MSAHNYTSLCLSSVYLSVIGVSGRLYISPCVCLSVCISPSDICLFVCSSVPLYVCPSVYLSFCMALCLCVCPSMCLSVLMCVSVSFCHIARLYVCLCVCLCLSVSLPLCMFVVSVSVGLYVCLSVYLFVRLYVYPSVSLSVYICQSVRRFVVLSYICPCPCMYVRLHIFLFYVCWSAGLYVCPSMSVRLFECRLYICPCMSVRVCLLFSSSVGLSVFPPSTYRSNGITSMASSLGSHAVCSSETSLAQERLEITIKASQMCRLYRDLKTLIIPKQS